jgi:cysteinyl-tRNA synthetase
VRVDNEKMSKSLGNFFTIREVMSKYDPEVMRYFILTSHYRSPLNYSDQHLENAKGALTTLYTALRGLPLPAAEPEGESAKRFFSAMDEDFNTPEAIAVLFEMAREVNRLRASDEIAAARVAANLRSLAEVLGLLQRDPEAFFQGEAGAAGLGDAEIEQFINDRLAARKARNWAEADRIRDELKDKGILLEDGASGTTWRRA